ncbi:MAG: ADP-glyceromanno-heptose 6-epimerase [Opitutales bacterium]|jgi:ADP-L-glycero-D-manno-heptose 6-epimerase
MPSLPPGRILVTGGAGFIGSALVWALNQRGLDNILVADFLGSDEKFKNLVPLRFADYLEADALLAALATDDPRLRDIRCVFHLGACSATTERDASYLIKNNYEFTKQLAHWSLAHGARFVYASSAATYGDGAQGMIDRDDQLERLRPLNMYGYSKHLFDLYARRHGLLSQIVGLKYFNVFGPNEDHKGDMRSVVHKTYHQIRATGRAHLFKSYRPDYHDGGQKRDFLYVKDAVAMTIHLAETPSASGLYNLGSGTAHTWIELVTAIFTALKLPPKIEFVDMPETLRPKYQYFTQADIAKLRSTGYAQPVIPLEDSVADYVSNYLASGRRLGE